MYRRPSLIVEQSLYIPSPNHWRKETGTNDGPILGSGVPRTYSIPAEQPRPSDMTVMPAFDLYPAMQPTQACPDAYELAKFQYGGAYRPHLPTFFRPANRAAAGKADPAGHPPFGLRMLVLSPARFSFWHAHQATAKDVRLGISERLPVRTKVPSISPGG